MEEIFKDIEGYEGLYQVSNTGKVKSIKFGKERILKPCKDKSGYLCVNICNKGKNKTFRVHRLVAFAFVQNNSLFNTDVNHIDENKMNNNANNLEWVTKAYNNNYGTRIERLSKKVLCVETNQIFQSTIEVERQLGFSQGNISKCCNGKRYKTVGGYHWGWVN